MDGLVVLAAQCLVRRDTDKKSPPRPQHARYLAQCFGIVVDVEMVEHIEGRHEMEALLGERHALDGGLEERSCAARLRQPQRFGGTIEGGYGSESGGYTDCPRCDEVMPDSLLALWKLHNFEQIQIYNTMRDE